MSEKALDKLDKQEKVFFIQIGANDGELCDPIKNYIRKDNWHGVMFEPLKDIYESLLNNHKKKKIKNITYENKAVSDTNGNKEMFRIPIDVIREKKYQNTIEGCSTFHKNRKGVDEPMKIFQDRFKDDVVSEEVECVTMKDYIKENDIKSIDLLQIDAEGHDYQILMDFPFEDVLPTVVRYETAGGKGVFSKHQLNGIKDLLKSHNYSIKDMIHDTIAWQSSVLK